MGSHQKVTVRCDKQMTAPSGGNQQLSSKEFRERRMQRHVAIPLDFSFLQFLRIVEDAICIMYKYRSEFAGKFFTSRIIIWARVEHRTKENIPRPASSTSSLDGSEPSCRVVFDGWNLFPKTSSCKERSQALKNQETGLAGTLQGNSTSA